MRIAYLDCATGISGDMTVAALLDLGVELDTLQKIVDSLRLPGVSLHAEEVLRGGFRAVHFRVEHPEQHAHRHLSDIIQILDRSDLLTDTQRGLALQMFRHVAEAEAKVHGMPIDRVHFHEVGAIDSIVDIVCAAVGFDILGADEIVCSPVPPGRGTVKIAHGECAVPTPGTAELLVGIPLADVPIATELTTPTGAAIVKTVVDRFATGWPPMSVQVVGCGAGTKEFPERANVLRIVVGESDADPTGDEVTLLETNLDNCSPEILGYTRRKLLDEGALDVYTTAIQMKKDRPGIMLSVICESADADELEAIIFTETPTLGIRRQSIRRTLRRRSKFSVDTDWGPVQGKVGWRDGEPAVFSPEYEDCVEIAKAYDIPLRDVYLAAQAEFLMSSEVDVDELDDDDDETEEHEHDCSRDHDHDHSHDHNHDHSHDHDHRHDHGHDHDHHHDH